jgi:hypothetical protein
MGGAFQETGGEIPMPSQVNFAGKFPLFTNAVLSAMSEPLFNEESTNSFLQEFNIQLIKTSRNILFRILLFFRIS